VSDPRVCLDLGTEIKAQHIRVLDVLFIGPLMVWGGWRARDEAPAAGYGLTAMGLATIYYNGRNYLRVRDQLRRQLPHV
jgi:hypothetical protein